MVSKSVFDMAKVQSFDIHRGCGKLNLEHLKSNIFSGPRGLKSLKIIFSGPTRSTTLEIQWFSFPRANFPLIFAIFTHFEIWKVNFCLSPSGVNLFFSTHFPENRMVHPLETATGFLLKKPEYKMFFSSLPNVNFSYNQSKNDDYFIFLFSKPLKSKNNILK